MISLVAAILITIPSIGVQAQVQPEDHPANMVAVGNFERLDELNLWDVVTIQTDDGVSFDYVVAWSRLYPTDELPPEVTDGPASGGTVLTLITDATDASDDLGYHVQRIVRAVPLP